MEVCVYFKTRGNVCVILVNLRGVEYLSLLILISWKCVLACHVSLYHYFVSQGIDTLSFTQGIKELTIIDIALIIKTRLF